MSQKVVVKTKAITDPKCLPQSGEHNSDLMQVVISSFLNAFRGFLENINSFSPSLYSYLLWCFFFLNLLLISAPFL